MILLLNMELAVASFFHLEVKLFEQLRDEKYLLWAKSNKEMKPEKKVFRVCLTPIFL